MSSNGKTKKIAIYFGQKKYFPNFQKFLKNFFFSREFVRFFWNSSTFGNFFFRFSDFPDFLKIFSDFFRFSFGFFRYFSKILRILLKDTEVTTEQQKWPKKAQTARKPL